MSDSTRSRRRTVIVILALLLLALFALLFFRCSCGAPQAPHMPPPSAQHAPAAPAPAAAPGPKLSGEVLIPATVQAPAQVKAGATFSVQWTGPGNADDYVTIVPKDAPASAYTNYRLTREGSTLQLTAPMEPGEGEVRYVAARSHTVLGHAPITVEPVEATLSAPAEAALGMVIAVAWTGPNNAGDYVVVVSKDAPDRAQGNYAETAKGSPLNLTLPPTAGEAELRYVSGQGGKVLGRRAINITVPAVTLSAHVEAIAGSMLSVDWTGPSNRGDYITLVAKSKPDGQYGNYTDVSKGSPLTVLVPIEPGEAELRYMTGQGAKVLARRPLTIVATPITLETPLEAAAGSPVTVTWTGPNHPGDYITIVPKTTRDGHHAAYAETNKGSPSKIAAPKEAGAAEVRYMSGQGAKVLARRAITIGEK